MWEIKGKNNTIKAIPSTKPEYNGVWMEQSYVTVNVESPTPIDFEIGDWLMYRDERFEINYDPGKIKCAPPYSKGDAFKYEGIKFNSLADELTRCDFLDVVLNDNQLHFTGLPKFPFYGNVQNLADRMQANLDRTYGKNTWNVVVSPEYTDRTEINVQVDNIKVQGALEILVNQFKAYYTVKGRTITIGAAGIPAGHLFKYGKGNGLYEIEQNAEADQTIVTRVRAYGSTRNLPHRYYNSLTGADGHKLIPDNMAVQNLMLPSFPYTTQDPYIDSPNIAKLGIREGTIFFDGSQEGLEEIYPSIEGMTAEQLKAAGETCNATGALDEIVSAEQMTDNGVGEIKDNQSEATPPTFKITLKDLGFDINKHKTTEAATLSFKTGKLGGRDFEIVKNGCKEIKNGAGQVTGYELELNRVYDDGIKLWFPYASYNAKAGDKFVLLHIEMPEVYIKAASQKLLEAATAWLAKNDYSRSVYAPKIDEIFMARQHDEAMASNGAIKSLHDTIREGMLLLFEDEDLNIDASIFIDRLIIKEEGITPTYEVVLKEEKTVGRLDKMQNQIDSLAAGRGQGDGGYNASQIRQLIDAYGGTRFLSKIKDDSTEYTIGVRDLKTNNFVKGFSGAQIDDLGNSEVESIVVRSFMKVYELIYNRLNALEGNTSFADSGTIETLIDNGDGTATAVMRKRWEGDFTSFQPGDVIYGFVNNLDNHTAVEYGKAWARVVSVDRAANTLSVVRYPDTAVPSGRNLALTDEMLISRWGNAIDPNTEAAQTNPDYASFIVRRGDTWINTRQQSFFISCDEGSIVELMGVDAPILRQGNYGTVLGQLPDGLLDEETAKLVNPGQPYLYARGIVVQDLIRIGYNGVRVRTPNFRGEWSKTEAENPDGGYHTTEDICDIVTWEGGMWQCLSPAAGPEPPSEGNPDWQRISGSDYSLWEVVPSVNIIYIRRTGYSTNLLECMVRRNNGMDTIIYTTPESLDTQGMELTFSLDGEQYSEFWVRQGDTVKAEDGVTVQTEAGGSLDMGGNNVPWIEIGDHIWLTLRDKTTKQPVTSVIVPVVRDGEDGQGTPGKDGKDGRDGSHPEQRFMLVAANGSDPALPDAEAVKREPSGWAIAMPSVAPRQSLWMIQATIDADNSIVGRWSRPIRLTGKDGNDGQDGQDGQPGKPGLMAYPCGAFDPMVTYRSTDEVTPVVQDGQTTVNGITMGQYYALYPNKTFHAGTDQYPGDASLAYRTPHEDAANNGGYWRLMDRFSMIFTDIIMARFGKIASAVFSGELMFSQQGVDNSGAFSDSYEQLGQNFNPNFMIDFKTGKVTARNVEVYGYLRQRVTVINEGNLASYALDPDDTDSRMLDWRLTGGSMRLESLAGSVFAVMPSFLVSSTSADMEAARGYVGVTAIIYNASTVSVGLSGVFAITQTYSGTTSDGHRVTRSAKATQRSSFSLGPGEGIQLRSHVSYERHWTIDPSTGELTEVPEDGRKEQLVWDRGDIFKIRN